ncbi:MAG: nuclear transport factor 2 family protein [Rhodococcus sp. (in: high G+C Gram-positive bacteria)]|uniref:nuclear transport factor 2 family protein n=1 Tax=Rhodococcus sp. TaxID=1831 RepID=UPI003BB7F007
MTFRTIATVAATAAALVAFTACSSSDDSTAEDTATASSTTASSAPETSGDTTGTAAAAPVTADVLQQQVTIFFDPAAPADAKAAVIENGSDRTAVLEQFNGVLAGYPLTGTVGEVTAVDADTVTASTEVAGPHGGAPMPLTFEQVDTHWVIADDSVCSIFELGHLPCD